MQDLINAILRMGSAALASEDAACDALAALRFPNGIVCRCGARCSRERARASCSRGHRFTLLVGTPFGTKTAPRIRALFLAIRAFAVSPRSVSARELARDVDMPHTTLWRHLLTLRAMLPPATAHPTTAAASVQVCGRHTDASEAWIRVGARTVMVRERSRDPSANSHVDAHGGRREEMGRMVGESIRTVVNGTFHGVSSRWLSAYVDEARARWRVASWTADALVERLVTRASPMTFEHVRRHFGALA